MPPDFYERSVVLAEQGRLDEALSLAIRATEHDPASATAHAQAGALLAKLSRSDEALGYLQRALVLDPRRADVLNNIGALQKTAGHLETARITFAAALALAPGYEDAIKNLAATLTQMGRPDEAIRLLETELIAGHGSAALQDQLGLALAKVGQHDRALVAYRRALALDPAFSDPWAHIGNVLVEQGSISEAVGAFLTAIAGDPNRGEFYRHLVDTDPSAVTDAHVDKLNELANGALTSVNRMEVNFALVKIYATRGEHARSFTHSLAASVELRKRLVYDEPAMLRSFVEIAEVFSTEYIAGHEGNGFPSSSPIFIVGMPRSGTTLIEQLLASHPAVYGAGELALFDETARPMLASGQTSLREIGERYATALTNLAPLDALRITDKMLDNFRYAGLIHLALPNAKIIHSMRDPLDTCISCFSNYFAQDAITWSYDLGELGRYYRGYEALMQHWRTALPPGAMLEVQYEEFVDDFEAQARRIIAYCDLSWDDRCLDFYKTERPVKTASASQVRRPIYRTSMRKAEAYGDLLRPLRDALGA